jgi:hypothetical protein
VLKLSEELWEMNFFTDIKEVMWEESYCIGRVKVDFLKRLWESWGTRLFKISLLKGVLHDR